MVLTLVTEMCDGCSGAAQQFCQFGMTLPGNALQRSPSLLILGVHVSVSSEQRLHDLLVSLPACHMQRGPTLAVRVIRVCDK